MCLALGPQPSDAGEARTRGPWVSSQALYHCAPRKEVNILTSDPVQATGDAVGSLQEEPAGQIVHETPPVEVL